MELTTTYGADGGLMPIFLPPDRRCIAEWILLLFIAEVILVRGPAIGLATMNIHDVE